MTFNRGLKAENILSNRRASFSSTQSVGLVRKNLCYSHRNITHIL